MNEKYGDGDVEVELLESEGEVWKTIFSDLKPVCFKDILEQLKSLSEAKKKIIPNFINICKPQPHLVHLKDRFLPQDGKKRGPGPP